MVTFGVKGGAIVTEPVERNDDSRHYIVGPYLEVRLPAHFAVEADALYSRFGTSLATAGATTLSARTRGDLWQFPILGKYYVPLSSGSGLHPFINGGVSLRRIWMDNGQNASFTGDFDGFFRRNRDFGAGATFGGGLDFRFKHIGIAPEFRYTRWEDDRFPATNPNEAQILLGIHF